LSAPDNPVSAPVARVAAFPPENINRDSGRFTAAVLPFHGAGGSCPRTAAHISSELSSRRGESHLAQGR
jgi:hypothetical protein